MLSAIQFPEGSTLLRSLTKQYALVSHGKGVRLYDTRGREYLDAAGGALVVSVGHGNQEVIARIAEQLGRVAYVNGMQFTSEPTERLSANLAKKAEGLGLDKVTFLSSGSEAVEAAIKFVRQMWIEREAPQRDILIARTPSYHGNTLYALSASGRPHYKKYFGPLLHDIVTVSAPYGYRYAGSDYESQGAEFYARELESAIQKAGSDRVMGFIVEPVIGSSAGAALPPQGYFERVQKVCAQYKVPIIADEVLCGSGRTGKFFASTHFGLKPDVLVLGKGLNGGYAPLSAVLVKSAWAEEMRRKSGYFLHAQTYMMAPCMTAAGLAVVEFMDAHRLLENCASIGDFFHRRMKDQLGQHAHIGAICGKGLLMGVEFISDKATKQPFSRKEKIAEKIVDKALENGLTLWPNVGQANGTEGDLVMMGPPLTLTEAEAGEIVERFGRSVKEVLGAG